MRNKQAEYYITDFLKDYRHCMSSDAIEAFEYVIKQLSSNNIYEDGYQNGYKNGYYEGLYDMADFCSSLMDDPAYYLEPEKLVDKFKIKNTTYGIITGL